MSLAFGRDAAAYKGLVARTSVNRNHPATSVGCGHGPSGLVVLIGVQRTSTNWVELTLSGVTESFFEDIYLIISATNAITL